MNNVLKPGQRVQTQLSEQDCTVEKLIGAGGQGEVYKVQWCGKPMALKWYFVETGTPAQRKAINRLVSDSAYRAPNQRFLWPEDLAYADSKLSFGYLMRLRDSKHSSLFDLMADRITPTFSVRARVGMELTDAYYQLHTRGLCYGDINFGNAFFDDVGATLICDNDNVRADKSDEVAVLGTPKFMAPEIVRGDALPSTETDLHSLAVLLFYIFHVGHPLMGKRLMNYRCPGDDALKKLYGTEPVFIFHPMDRSNEAVPKSIDGLGECGNNALKYWPLYPQFLKDHFVQSFVDGLHSPDRRVRESQWRTVLSQLRDSIFYCPCDRGTENFCDPAAMKATGGLPGNCWNCGRPLRLPFRLRVGKSLIMLNHNSRLHPHHLDAGADLDFITVVAEVVQRPDDPHIWGLKNCGEVKWVAKLLDGSLKDVPPGKSVQLVPNMKINFGKVEGEVRF